MQVVKKGAQNAKYRGISPPLSVVGSCSGSARCPDQETIAGEAGVNLYREHLSTITPSVSLFSPIEPDSPCLRIHISDYGDGRVEAISVFQSEPTRWGKKKKDREKKTDRSEMDSTVLLKSQLRAKRTVKERLLMIRADHMLTFTFRDNITSPDIAWLIWHRFRRCCKKQGLDFPYVCVPEKQKRGAIHFHVGTKGYLNYNVLRHHWHKAIIDVTGADRQKKSTGHASGFVSPGSVNGRYEPQKKQTIKMSRYLTKYLTKDDMGAFGKKRYSSSKGIPDPNKETFFLTPGPGSFLMIKKMIEKRYGVHVHWNEFKIDGANLTYFSSDPYIPRQKTEEHFIEYDTLIDAVASYRADEPPF